MEWSGVEDRFTCLFITMEKENEKDGLMVSEVSRDGLLGLGNGIWKGGCFDCF